MLENANVNKDEKGGYIVTFRFIGVGWSFDKCWEYSVKMNAPSVVQAFNNFAKPLFCDLFPNVSAAVFRKDGDGYVFYDYVSADAFSGKSANGRKG